MIITFSFSLSYLLLHSYSLSFSQTKKEQHAHASVFSLLYHSACYTPTLARFSSLSLPRSYFFLSLSLSPQFRSVQQSGMTRRFYVKLHLQDSQEEATREAAQFYFRANKNADTNNESGGGCCSLQFPDARVRCVARAASSANGKCAAGAPRRKRFITSTRRVPRTADCSPSR